jgi:hypothetical protein
MNYCGGRRGVGRGEGGGLIENNTILDNTVLRLLVRFLEIFPVQTKRGVFLLF